MAKLTCSVISYTLLRTVDITVVIPTVTIPGSMGMDGQKPRHTPEYKFPVLYLLHGMGNDHSGWTAYTNVEFFAEERNIAVVMISGENKAYIDWEGGDQFYKFIEEELPDFVCGLFPISDRPEDTYIAGLSMGGYGTLVHALGAPERYAAFGAFSAAINMPKISSDMDVDKVMAESAGGAAPAADKKFDRFDPNDLADKIAADGKKFPKVYMACGGKDFLLQSNHDFRDKLISLGADVTYDEIPEYGHEWRFWNIEVEKFLDWLPRTDPYAGKKRQI